jgi:hypothetical protein
VNDDRVSELYLGEGRFATSAGHVACKTRIDWMVSQARGKTLDIGSSQGIVSILVGRSGLDVTGIEVEELALEHARKALAAEPEQVRKLVKFPRHFYDNALANQQFDTVLLGEILEHHPPRASCAARPSSPPNGRSSAPRRSPPPAPLISGDVLFDRSSTRSPGRHLTHLDSRTVIRFVVSKGPQGNAVKTDADSLLALSESGFLAIQETVELLKTDYNARGARIAAANERIKSLGQKLEQAAADLAASRAALAAEREAHRKTHGKVEQLESYLTAPEDASPRLRGFSVLVVCAEVNGWLRSATAGAAQDVRASARPRITSSAPASELTATIAVIDCEGPPGMGRSRRWR